MLKKLWRLLRHRWLDAGDVRRQIGEDVLARLADRIRDSEAGHRGELRLCIEAGLPFSYLWRDDPIETVVHDRALALFGKLRVWDTEDNSGVLIYLLMADHQIEIVADRGLARHVAQAEWNTLVRAMEEAFRRGDYEGGLNQAVERISTLLLQHFPLSPGQHNPDELPNPPHLI